MISKTFSTLIVVTERFAEAATRLGIENLAFTELEAAGGRAANFALEQGSFDVVVDGLAGDHVLAALGRLLASRFRTEDLRGRWGGEEFMLAFPNESAEVGEGALQRVLKEFSLLQFRDDKGGTFTSTFTAGVASYPADGQTVQALLQAADRRLYLAKSHGRNQVCREG